MNSKEIFVLALGLQSPWEIKEVRFESIMEYEREIHIYIDFKRGYKFTTRIGEQTVAYDTEDRQWQHLNFFQHKCYLHARVPRLYVRIKICQQQKRKNLMHFFLYTQN